MNEPPQPEPKEIFILDANREKPDGTIEQLSEEETQALMHPDGHIETELMEDGTVTITWIEGQPEQILSILLGYPYFGKAEDAPTEQ